MFCTRSTWGFILMIFLSLAYFVVELVFGHYSNTISLISDAYHMFGDVFGFGIGLFALVFSKEKSIKYSYGRSRSIILGGLTNAVFMITLCWTIMIEIFIKIFSIYKILNYNGEDNSEMERVYFIQKKDFPSILWIAILGLIINIIGFFVINHNDYWDKLPNPTKYVNSTNDAILNIKESKPHETKKNFCKKYTNFIKNYRVNPNLNIRGVLLHIIGDIMGSIMVIVNATIMLKLEYDWVQYFDPICSSIIVIILMIGTVPIIGKTCRILMQKTPDRYNLNNLKSELKNEVPQIMTIESVHIWSLDGQNNVSTISIILYKNYTFRDTMQYKQNIRKFFSTRNVDNINVQINYI
ncbi:hypothetical protein A3Q56_01670 [Intoshia linei]|uniref:Cation efflux protein transmembrane domain-containing protein n=1 Tax=Intoshia linei TaxID=1819745 RepID=A0A177BAY0_9BILA|nr:hypothetical protein A3Q56_01670 [Intoshia linei]